MAHTLNFSDGSKWDGNVVTIDDANGCARGYVAHFTESLQSSTQVAVFGACDEKHDRPTVLQMALLVRRFYPNVPIFRNGRRYQYADK